jgi:opacity protein-like surface antigen
MKKLLLAAVAALALSTAVSSAVASTANQEFLNGFFTFWVYDQNCKPEKPYSEDPVIVLIGSALDAQFSEREQKEGLASAMSKAKMMNNFCGDMKPVLEKTYLELKEWAAKKK